jgi:hypothetical protein
LKAIEQTLRLRLVSGPVDKTFFSHMGNSLSHTAGSRTYGNSVLENEIFL